MDTGCCRSRQGCDSYHDQPTVLDLAIQRKENDRVQFFLARGANFCSSSLRIAVVERNEAMINQIIASGADINEGKTT